LRPCEEEREDEGAAIDKKADEEKKARKEEKKKLKEDGGKKSKKDKKEKKDKKSSGDLAGDGDAAETAGGGGGRESASDAEVESDDDDDTVWSTDTSKAAMEARASEQLTDEARALTSVTEELENASVQVGRAQHKPQSHSSLVLHTRSSLASRTLRNVILSSTTRRNRAPASWFLKRHVIFLRSEASIMKPQLDEAVACRCESFDRSIS